MELLRKIAKRIYPTNLVITETVSGLNLVSL